MKVGLEAFVVYTQHNSPELNRVERLAQERTRDSISNEFAVSVVQLSAPGTFISVADQLAHASTAAWVLVMRSGEAIPAANHVSRKVSNKVMPPNEIEILPYETEWLPWGKPSIIVKSDHQLSNILQVLPPNITSCCMPYFTVEDYKGDLARGLTREAWLVRPESKFHTTPYGFYPDNGTIAMLVEHPVIRQPVATLAFEIGEFQAVVSSEIDSTEKNIQRLNLRAFIKSRAELEKQEALVAFKTLFKHMSLSEELWRLKEMMRYLPFTIDETPEVEEMRHLLKMQIGHLEGKDGELGWYRDDSPAEVINSNYATAIGLGPSPRVKWMVDEARKHEFKRVVELGSLDGVNMFAYIALAPEIEWHGVEVNPKGKAHADKLCAELGIPALSMHTATFQEFARLCHETGNLFDAASVFEVLEHNFNPNPILDAAEACVHAGGRIYITTPNGNWSAHDESTRVISLRKDHVRAWTIKRMRALLEERNAKDIEIFVVDNPAYWEGNSWVYASYCVQNTPRQPTADPCN